LSTFIKTFLCNDPTFQKLKAFEPIINANLKLVDYGEKFKLKRAYHSPLDKEIMATPTKGHNEPSSTKIAKGHGQQSPTCCLTILSSFLQDKKK